MMPNDPPDAPDAFESPDPGWRFRLARPKDGDVFVTLHNAMMILANDDPFTGTLGPMFAFDSYRCQAVLLRPPPRFDGSEVDERGPYPRPWNTTDITLVTGYLQCAWNKNWPRANVADAMEVVARQNSYHPILDWINSLRWDGVYRIDTWMVEAFDVRNEFDRNGDEAEYARWKAREDYYAAIGARMLVASVRRLRRPGVKFDSMLILEGEQRLGKSTVIEVLYGKEFFTDTVFADLRNKEAAQGLFGKWVVEFSEIEQVIRSDVETLKAFLSRNTDHFRPPYERHFRDVPREGVFFGTTNQQDYLKDTTGNTRFWPAFCQKADVQWIIANREQLWAEAAAREAEGDDRRLWLDTDELQAEAARLTNTRMREDIWTVAVQRWVAKTERERSEAKARIIADQAEPTDAFLAVEPIYVARILEHAIGMTKDKMSKVHEMRVAEVLKAMGWIASRHVRLPTVKNELSRGKTTTWQPPDEAPGT
jgi:predicted P-loop ATPase